MNKISMHIFRGVKIITAILVIAEVISIIHTITVGQSGSIVKLLIYGLNLIIIFYYYKKKLNNTIFLFKCELIGFLYFVFIIGEAIAMISYFFWSLKNSFQEDIEAVCFMLYMGVYIGIAVWCIFRLYKKNIGYDTLKGIIKPLVLFVTLWGYSLNKFGNYSKKAVIVATIVLSISFVIDFISYVKEQKETVDIAIKETSTVYEICVITENGVEHNYKITVKKDKK